MTFFDHTPIPEGVHGHDGRLPYDPRENALTIAGDTPEEFAGPRLFAPPPPPQAQAFRKGRLFWNFTDRALLSGSRGAHARAIAQASVYANGPCTGREGLVKKAYDVALAPIGTTSRQKKKILPRLKRGKQSRASESLCACCAPRGHLSGGTVTGDPVSLYTKHLGTAAHNSQVSFLHCCDCQSY